MDVDPTPQDRKLESEIALNQAQINLLQQQVQELEKNRVRGFYRDIVKAFVGGLVLAALVTTWGVEYFKPILEKKQEISSMDNTLIEIKNEITTARNEITLDSITKEKIKLEIMNLDLQNQNASLIEEYRFLLNENRVSKADKERYLLIIKHLEGEREKSKSQNITKDENLVKWLTSKSWILDRGYSVNNTYFPDTTLCSFRTDGTFTYKQSNNNFWEVHNGSLKIRINDTLFFTAAVSTPNPVFIKGIFNRKDIWNIKLMK